MLLALLLAPPACIAIDSQSHELFQSGQARDTSFTRTIESAPEAMSDLRAGLRAALRPAFELSVLALCGLAAAMIIAFRCRRIESARLKNLRQLRLLNTFENAFPSRLTGELRGLLARINGRSELLLERLASSGFVDQALPVHNGLRVDAETLRQILLACEQLERTGPELNSARQSPVDLGALLGRLSSIALPYGPVARVNHDLLEIALTLLLRASDLSGATNLSIHISATTQTRIAKSPAAGAGPEERALIVIRSGLDHTAPGMDAGLAISHRIVLSLGGKLRITTEHNTGSTIEVELPL